MVVNWAGGLPSRYSASTPEGAASPCRWLRGRWKLEAQHGQQAAAGVHEEEQVAL